MSNEANRPIAIVVDDEPAMAELTSEASTLAGFETVVAHSGMRLLELIRSHDADVIVLDIVMPDLDGIEVLKECAKLDCGAKIILVSGYNECMLNSSKLLGDAYGLDIAGIVTKPFQLSQLINQLKVIRDVTAVKGVANDLR